MIVDNVKFTHRKVARSVQVDVSWCFFSQIANSQNTEHHSVILILSITVSYFNERVETYDNILLLFIALMVLI